MPEKLTAGSEVLDELVDEVLDELLEEVLVEVVVGGLLESGVTGIEVTYVNNLSRI